MTGRRHDDEGATKTCAPADDAATVCGGVRDSATEEQLVTPWTVSVAR
jgi:hypothetical protein